jgi:protein SCO1/2
VGPGWLFLTGSAADIRLITRKLGLGTLQQTDARESHSATLSIGDVPSGRWMKSASTDNPQFLAAHMATFLGWPDDAAVATQGEARALAIGDGEFLFRNGCAACHSIGGGRKIGPDLQDVSRRRDAAWLHRFIRAPDRMFAEGDALALKLLDEYQGLRMPNLDLTAEEVAAIVGYIDARSARLRQPSGQVAAR